MRLGVVTLAFRCRIIGAAAIVLVAGCSAAAGPRAVPAPSPRPAPGYLLTASGAHFTTLFTRKPLHIEKTTGTITIIIYVVDLPGHDVGIICAPVPASGSISLDRAVDVVVSASGGQVVSRYATTYHGQSAEDADVLLWGLPGQILVMAFGSSLLPAPACGVAGHPRTMS